jgi:hypothetical protein
VSDFDTAVADMDASLFEVMGDDATVQRGAGAPQPVRVVVARNQAKLGEYGKVVARLTTALFRNSQWEPQQGDVLTLTDGARRVASIDAEQSDDYVTMAVLHG